VEETFWEANGEWVAAAVTLLVTFVLAFVVDRLVIGRTTKVATRVTDTTMSRAAQTRLRMIRRLVFVTIIVIGVGIALSQFDNLN
jgi:small-conductance mechanosensitive channel